MADLPMAQIPNFQLPGPQVPYQGNLAQGLAAGAQQGGEFFNRQMALQQRTAALQLEAQKQKFEQGSSLVQNALAAYDSYGDAAGHESFNAFKQGMNMIAPGSVDPNAQWDESMGNVLKTANDAFEAVSSGKRPLPEAMAVVAKAFSQASKQQRAKMQPIVGGMQDMYNQEQTNQRIQSEQIQNTQRNYADHANSLIQTGSALNAVNDLLSKKDAAADDLAKAKMQSLIANGAISQNEVTQLTKAGGPFEKVEAWWNSTTKGTLDAYHREQFQKYIPSKIAELNNSLQSLASTFPGAQAAHINPRLYGQSKSGKPMYSDDGGKTWLYQR